MVEGRGGSTRQLLIDATALRLLETDESELRIADICEDTGFSSSVIYSNFRSRQGLIDATFLQFYEDRARRYVELLRENTADAHSLDSLLAFYRVGTTTTPRPGDAQGLPTDSACASRRRRSRDPSSSAHSCRFKSST